MIFRTIHYQITVFHLVGLAEITHFNTDHAEYDEDMRSAAVTKGG